MSALGAARVEQKIVKVPKDEAIVAFGRSQPIAAGGDGLEQDPAIDEQGENLDLRKAGMPAQSPDLLRRRQHRQRGRNLRIANLEKAPARGDFSTMSLARRRI